MRKRWAVGLAVLFVLPLAGCADSVFGLAKDLIGGSNDNNNQSTMAALSFPWTVNSYTGATLGQAVVVPDTTHLRWTLRTDGTFSLTSDHPVPEQGGTRTYNEAGTWRIVNGTTGTLGLTVTVAAGQAIPTGQQVEVTGTWVLSSARSLVILTSAFGPGDVRYVMVR